MYLVSNFACLAGLSGLMPMTTVSPICGAMSRNPQAWAVQPGASALFYQPNDGLPNGFTGGVRVASSQAKVVGVVNELSLAQPNAGDWLLTYDGFNR